MQQLLDIILRDPFEWFVALVTFFYFMRGKHWHGIYAMYLLLGVYAVAKEVGINQTMAGVILGVFANEIFRFIRLRLEKEA
jgi:hypothetical protein